MKYIIQFQSTENYLLLYLKVFVYATFGVLSTAKTSYRHHFLRNKHHPKENRLFYTIVKYSICHITLDEESLFHEMKLLNTC